MSRDLSGPIKYHLAIKAFLVGQVLQSDSVAT